MFQNYVKIAWRNICKNPFVALINIFGLSIAIAFIYIIGIYVWQETNVNHKLKNSANQFIIQSKWKDGNMSIETTTIAQLPVALKNQYPNLVANYYRWDGVTAITSKDDLHSREVIAIGDSTAFGMYGFEFAYGGSKQNLAVPDGMVISEEKAVKYFGKVDAVGKTLTLENFAGKKQDFIVKGVLKKMPFNSVTQLNNGETLGIFLPVSAAKFFDRTMEGWANFYIMGFVELQPGASISSLNTAMNQLIQKNAAGTISSNLTAYALPLTKYYLSSTVTKMLYTLSFTALFILTMAVVNFVNISVSNSVRRLREMGLRKVLGSMRRQLVGQFLVESVLTVLMANFIALIIYLLARPYFGNLLNTELARFSAIPLSFYGISILFAVIIGLIAGAYPAIYLSSLNSIDSLKGKVKQAGDKILFRKILVVFQFSVAATVLIAAVLISKQVNLFFGEGLGYDKEQVIYTQVPRDWTNEGVDKMETVRNEIAALPQVSNVTLSYSIPDGNFGSYMQAYKAAADSTQAFSSVMLPADKNFAATYNIPLIAGEFFKTQYVKNNVLPVVINEAHAKKLGFKNAYQAIEQNFKAQDMPLMNICGVVKDFQFGTMHDKISPSVFVNVKDVNYYRYFSIKLKRGPIESSLNAIKNKWAQLMPDAPFESNFVDAALERMYSKELQLKKASYVATAFTVIIVLLGVLALVSDSLYKRTKEVGVRKVLGASIFNITQLFLKDFFSTVLIACVIACPVAYILINKWLNDYAYKIVITITPFVFTIAALTMLTALVISIQTLKAAAVNPVKSLRQD
ncbi:ABC transporter permease [Mucilaginibacter aquatilis]|uniref:FtsX-like permease family protein n=1 Tax=Mucilaginibacter aquatilis TaxID=1517760 RepID=A0A6I4IR39_9SPHI|nr:ABC transporter permease [Mucilaginibacter aquatilis]MVN92873.1 FtsX-like permease family protein [Mucilaginibacter aquatilis]